MAGTAKEALIRQILAELTKAFDDTMRNDSAARSLEDFYRNLDVAGTGQVRTEDFKAGWALGGVKLNTHQLNSLQGAFGNTDGKIYYEKVIEAMDSLGHEGCFQHVMVKKMGPMTAQYMGLTTQGAAPGQLSASLSPKSQKGLGETFGTINSPNSLMRTTNIKPVAAPTTTTPKGTFNSTAIKYAAVTQRHRSTVPEPAAAVVDRIVAASEHSSQMVETLKALDESGTGCATLDAFLTACARAGLTLRPGELDAMRQHGLLKRPYNAAPELVEYAALGLAGCN